MGHRTSSSLPSLMMPCPVCAGRMVFQTRRPVSVEIEDTIYACRNCGAELISTTGRSMPRGGRKAQAA